MRHVRQLRIFIFARVLVTFLFLLSIVALVSKEPEAIRELTQNGIVRLMAFSFFFSVVSYVLSKKQQLQLFVAFLQTIWDLLFVTVLLLFTGGVASPYSFLYLLSIMNAGVLLGRRQAFYTASLCGILYGAISDFQYFGFLEPIGLNQTVAQQLGAAHILYIIFMNLIGFYLTCFITGYLSEVAQRNADELVKKSIDYAELERLNTTIVSNVESGLITVTPDERIRVFNPYAEMITEKSQADVYDMSLREVFPALMEALEDVGRASVGEFAWSLPNRPSLILGYSSVPFTDMGGERAGTIINFKDLTAKRQMEEALKRNDKLAALGGLAARIAHEIRNPLAAMSGSVQLLADHGAVAESDQRLLSIILRETERLNALITGFLTYARPVSPQREYLNLADFIEDLRLQISSDQRFDGIELVNSVPECVKINVDVNQIRQVFINLLHNAAEAMRAGGRITIEALHGRECLQGRRSSEVTNIIVTDTGDGISEETAAHLFEPFWTTKRDGTGLGLAICYRIIEEHGGMIKAESPTGGGCRITITLPG